MRLRARVSYYLRICRNRLRSKSRAEEGKALETAKNKIGVNGVYPSRQFQSKKQKKKNFRQQKNKNRSKRRGRKDYYERDTENCSRPRAEAK